MHLSGQVLADLAVAVADGAKSISDLASLRARPDLFGLVASTATAWRVLTGWAMSISAVCAAGVRRRGRQRGPQGGRRTSPASCIWIRCHDRYRPLGEAGCGADMDEEPPALASRATTTARQPHNRPPPSEPDRPRQQPGLNQKRERRRLGPAHRRLPLHERLGARRAGRDLAAAAPPRGARVARGVRRSCGGNCGKTQRGDTEGAAAVSGVVAAGPGTSGRPGRVGVCGTRIGMMGVSSAHSSPLRAGRAVTVGRVRVPDRRAHRREPRAAMMPAAGGDAGGPAGQECSCRIGAPRAANSRGRR